MGSNGIRFSVSDLTPRTARILPTLHVHRLNISLYDAQFDLSTGARIPIPHPIIKDIVAGLLRFQIICADFGVPRHHIRIIATEATRTAINHTEFLEEIHRETGLSVELLAKEDEGKIGAFGIASSFPEMEGVVMDLGGGSTQLTWLATHEGRVKMSPKGAFSFPYGAAALTKKLKELAKGKSHNDAQKALEKFREEMRINFLNAYMNLQVPRDMIDRAKQQNGFSLYLSGGGFRGWGYLLLYQNQTKGHDYPISIINGFKAPSSEFTDTEKLKEVARTSHKIFRVSDRRREQVPAVAFVVNVLANALPHGIKEAHFCQGGVREGVLFQALPQTIRMQHPLTVATSLYAKDSAAGIARLLLHAIPAYDAEYSSLFPGSIGVDIVQALANTVYVHSVMSKESASSSSLYSTSTGFLSSAHGVSHTNRALLALILEESYEVNCPQPRPNIRNSTSISPEETEWLEKRQNNTVWALRDFLSRANISGFDANGYLDRIMENGTALPNVGIAVSGGGWRALMNGAGAIAAFDNTTTNSTSPGHVGGLLQTATYLTGLSGGSWLVGSLYVPQLRSVQELYRMDPNAPDSLWQFDNSIVEGSSGTSPSAVHTDEIGPTTLRTSEYYDQITDEVENKENVGFNTTITDLWGRGLSFQLFNAKDGGPSKDRSLITLGFLLIRSGDYTFSNLTQNGAFQSAQVPLPIIVAIERPPNQLLILENSSIYEINPWEIGTFDPPTTAFAPLQYVGSNFSGGIVLEGQSCVSGFDNMGFVVGTSSSLFNQAYLQVNNTSLPSRVVDYVSRKLEEIGNENNDVSYWTNPFYQFNPAVNMNAKNRILPLVDGGEDLQNIPLHPLLQPPRKVDVIFAVDSSADTSSPGAYWPNGTSLVATYQRSLLKSGHGFPFPVVPDQNTFVNLGLNSKPTFFGCDPENTTQPTPLIVYLPNSPYTYYSNISTFQMETNDTQRNSIIQNGYDVATRAILKLITWAAVQPAQYVGTQMFITVSSSKKRRFLQETFGLRTDQIFNSRNTDFADQTLTAINGHGVDVVLNSLTGDMLEESLRIIADGGVMVKISKKDILDRNKLPITPFDRNISFSAVD
ncbi:lysophospholipase [Curvularia clavata]|uniref:Lysophospholipase n=1 Tax=Curvularia clavata TaxID=95742 RepID=A0A9Q9DTQ6_CURCL|nr:lysophospholipase [Curvularia clavata]